MNKTKKITYKQGKPTPQVSYADAPATTPPQPKTATPPDNSALAKSFRDWKRIGQGIDVRGSSK